MKRQVLAAALGMSAVCAACAKPEQSPPGAPPAAAAATPNQAATPTPSAMPTPTPEGPRPPAAADGPGTRLSASRAAEEECVDKWLAGRGLDRYGNPRGTMYAGGTPLFDERTGEHVDRLAYVYKRQPLAREACRPTAVH
jgi:hypothetical protein